jgi:hypothetical protein
MKEEAMTATTQEPQAPEVAELSEDTRKELVALREGGMTVAELKARFPQLTGQQIIDVLPPGNKREAKQREAKQGIGGRSGEAQSDPKPPKDEAPKAPPAPRYVEDTDLVVNLSERALACRQVMGRNALAEALEVTGSAVWRFENGRIHPTEVKPLQDGLVAVEKRIASGEFVKPDKAPAAKSPSKAEIAHRLEAVLALVRQARDATKVAEKNAALDLALTVEEPAQPTA